MTMAYTLVEHRHRFAAWAAGRASVAKGHRFTVEDGRRLLEITDIPEYAADMGNTPSEPDEFDSLHRKWRKDIIEEAKLKLVGGRENCVTHGVAAKLINVYLKAALVIVAPTLEGCARAKNVHPPVDKLLLMSLANHTKPASSNRKRSANRWRKYASIGWSNFDSEKYEEVISEIRNFSNGKPLWSIEEHWIGFQGMLPDPESE